MMKENRRHSDRWPADVPYEISGYKKPVYSVLDNSAREYPKQICTIYNGATRTYEQVLDTANRVANFLISRKIQKGDRVAIFLPNLPHYPAVFFGILKAGAVCVTCNPLYTAKELNFQLKDCGAKAVFCMDHPQFYPTTVKATHQDHILFAISDDNIAFFINMTDIPGQKILTVLKIAEDLFILFRMVTISLHYLRAADGNFSIFALGQFLKAGFKVHDLHISITDRKTHRTEFTICSV